MANTCVNCAEPLVEPQWLANKIKSGDVNNLKIFDCTFTDKGLGLDSFKSGHIQGAQFLSVLDLRDEIKNVIPLNPPSPEAFQRRIRSLGVNTDSHVIIYEDVTEHGYTGPRVWSLFRAFGHTNVSVLNGGLKKWRSLGLPLTKDVCEVQEGNFQASYNCNKFLKYDEVRELLKDPSQIIDARPIENFNGDEKEPSFLLGLILVAFGIDKSGLNIATGHLDTSKNIPYPYLFEEEDQVSFKSVPELKKVFQDAGIDLNKPVVTTCYVGLCACQLQLAAALCGQNDVRVYTGAWLEYGQKTASL